MPPSATPRHRLLQQTAAKVCSDILAITADTPDVSLLKPPSIIRAEANLLRFPFFALHTKGRWQMDGVQCIGRKRINGKSHKSTLSITRNTKYLYPGSLSRKVHFALLDLMEECGFPYENPITWKRWTDLTDRMDIEKGGSGNAAIKNAIRATAGVLIVSNYALTTEVGKRRYPLPQDEFGYHLYDGYRFKNDVQHDGTVTEDNRVWFSEWYLSNLNSRYWGPLDYPTWLALDQQSHIASRLYEFFLFNFTGLDDICINYATLAQFLPVKVERSLSLAQRQLERAVSLARQYDVLGDVRWTTGKRGQLQLRICPGLRLVRQPVSTVSDSPQILDFAEDVVIRELRSTDTPAALLVREFHEQWSGNLNYKPTKSELECAGDMLDAYGRQRAELLLPKVIRTMRCPQPEGFPQAKYFSAAKPFFANENAKYERRKQQHRVEQESALQDAKEAIETTRAKEARQRGREDVLPIWEGLSTDAQSANEKQAYEQQNSDFYRRKFREDDTYRLQQCLDGLILQNSKNVA